MRGPCGAHNTNQRATRAGPVSWDPTGARSHKPAGPRWATSSGPAFLSAWDPVGSRFLVLAGKSPNDNSFCTKLFAIYHIMAIAIKRNQFSIKI